MRVSIEFDDRKFRLSHTRKPAGRGSWAFSFSVGSEAAWFAPGSLSLTEAKILARVEARARCEKLHPRNPAPWVLVEILP